MFRFKTKTDGTESVAILTNKMDTLYEAQARWDYEYLW